MLILIVCVSCVKIPGGINYPDDNGREMLPVEKVCLLFYRWISFLLSNNFDRSLIFFFVN